MIQSGSSKGNLKEEDLKVKTSQFPLHSLSSLHSKFVVGIPGVVAHEEVELARLAKMIKCSSLGETKGETLLKRIIPKYKPNSKVKAAGGGGQGKDKIKHGQTLRPSHADSESGGGGLTNLTSNTTKSTSKIKPGKGRTRKVRFDKKVTIHYVPADEERGSFEWRKNLTRQGIYQAMLWKTELKTLELEEALSLNQF